MQLLPVMDFFIGQACKSGVYNLPRQSGVRTNILHETCSEIDTKAIHLHVCTSGMLGPLTPELWREESPAYSLLDSQS